MPPVGIRRSGGRRAAPPATIGWREWVALPDLGVAHVKVKVDTGARTSALHAFGIVRFDRDGEPWVRFEVHPHQASKEGAVTAEAPLVDHRSVKSSTGAEQRRLVIMTEVQLDGQRWPIEVTLTRRDEMGFRMLLGREAVRGRFAVDPGRSYLFGRPEGVPRRRKPRRDAAPGDGIGQARAPMDEAGEP